MTIIKYENKYKKSFIECFVSFGKSRGYFINKNLIIKKIEKKLQDSKYLYLYVVKEDIIGFLWGKIIETDNIFSENIQKGHISYLYVDKEYGGRGYATKLKNVFFKELIENKEINHFELNLSVKNKLGLEIYKKWGFIEKKIYMVARNNH